MEERPIKKAGPMEERIIGFLRADVLQLNDRGGLALVCKTSKT
jgi:hypothetical protein